VSKAETKSCIACAEDIKADAILCKHCKTRQDEPTFQKLAPKAPKQAAAKPKSTKSKSLSSSSNESTFPDVKPGVVFAVIAAVVVVVFAVTQANSLDLGRTSEPESNSGTSSSSSSINSSLKGEVGYYCEPNLCHLLITNVGSDPVSLSGDLCGVLDGAVYIGDNYVSEMLNPKITYEVDFSFLGPYQGDRLSKIWLGDCADESSAELKWTNLSVGSSSSSDSGSGGTSSNAPSDGQSQPSSAPSSSESVTEQSPTPTNAPTPSNDEVFRAWASTIQGNFVSEGLNTRTSRYEVQVSFSFEPYPFGRNDFVGIHTFTSEGGSEVSLWEATFSMSRGTTTAITILNVDDAAFRPLTQFTLALHDGPNVPDPPIRFLTISK
jgi:hypothetical protein